MFTLLQGHFVGTQKVLHTLEYGMPHSLTPLDVKALEM